MSASTVGQVLDEQATTLSQKLAENVDVANMVMGIIGKLIWVCAQAGKPITGIRFGDVAELQGDFTFRVSFTALNLTPSMGLFPVRNDVLDYIGGRSAHMAKAVAVNPEFVKTFTNLVIAFDRYCERKRIKFKDFRIKKVFMTQNDVVVIKSGLQKLTDRWGR